MPPTHMEVIGQIELSVSVFHLVDGVSLLFDSCVQQANWPGVFWELLQSPHRDIGLTDIHTVC